MNFVEGKEYWYFSPKTDRIVRYTYSGIVNERIHRFYNTEECRLEIMQTWQMNTMQETKEEVQLYCYQSKARELLRFIEQKENEISVTRAQFFKLREKYKHLEDIFPEEFL